MWSSLTNTKKDNWLHLMSKILGGPCLLSGRLSFSLLKSKAKKCLRKTCKEYEKKSICPSLVGQWAWVWSWETPRACRTPYIPLLMSPCRQALSPSGTRLTSSLTAAAACLHNPNQEVLENKNFLYTSGIMRGHWTEQKLQYEEKQINCLKKRYLYRHPVVYFTLTEHWPCRDYTMTFMLKEALPSSFWR